MMRLYVVYNYKDIFPELSGRALTDALIRRCLGNEEVEIRRTEKGKPIVSCPGVYISVSHSGGTFALAESDGEVGLDIQYARNIKAERIASRYFAGEEADSVVGDETGDRFFELWTCREAYSKYTGEGLAQVMKKELVLGREDVRFASFRLNDGCFCSICTGAEEGEQTDEIQISYGE